MQVKIVTIENPLPKSVEIHKVTCEIPTIMIKPEKFSIPSKSETGFEIFFRPLVVGDSKGKVTAASEELGDYVYELNLKALQSNQQRSMHFKTPLGNELVQAFRFQHFLKKQCQYQIKVESLSGGLQEFFPDKPNCDVQAAESYEGVEGVCDIRYEPCNLRASRAMLTLTNAEGGVYTCLLNGQASAPKPSGPFKVPSKGASIPFKNPFSEGVDFEIRLDNPSFTSGAKSASVRLEAKKETSI